MRPSEKISKKKQVQELLPQIKQWLSDGMSYRQISITLSEKYQLSISKDTVHRMMMDYDIQDDIAMLVAASAEDRRSFQEKIALIPKSAEEVAEKPLSVDLAELSLTQDTLHKLFLEAIKVGDLNLACKLVDRYHKFISLTLRFKGLVKDDYMSNSAIEHDFTEFEKKLNLSSIKKIPLIDPLKPGN